MFEDKNAVILQQAIVEDEPWDLWQLLQGVGRIGEYEIVLLFARLHEAEDITAQRQACVSLQLLNTIADKAMMVAVLLDADDPAASTRQQFQRDTARAREEIEGCGSIEIQVARQNVEDVLLGEIRRGSRLERTRHVEVPSFISSRDNPHNS